MKRVAVLGSTGSVGRQALEVIAACPTLSLAAIGCAADRVGLLAQAARYGVSTLLCLDCDFSAQGYEVIAGKKAFADYAANGEYDILLVACASTAGLAPTLAALSRNKRVALANKETLVVGAHLVQQTLAQGGELLPVDSEHSAIHQCLAGSDPQSIAQIILTASGGALRDMPLDLLPMATRVQVLAHPTWHMGDKITVDCATMINKGFEVIEAACLFGVSVDKVDALLHRQSVVHSMVRFVDNSYMAQMAVGDMRLPIQYSLLYPDRVSSLVAPLDLCTTLSFEPIDGKRYPAYYLTRSVADDQAKRAALEAADGYVVSEFLAGHIPFGIIHTILEQTVSHFSGNLPAIEDIVACQSDAIALAKEMKNAIIG